MCTYTKRDGFSLYFSFCFLPPGINNHAYTGRENYQIKTPSVPAVGIPAMTPDFFCSFSLFSLSLVFVSLPSKSRDQTIVFYYLFPRIFIRFSSLCARTPWAHNCMENRCTLYIYLYTCIYIIIIILYIHTISVYIYICMCVWWAERIFFHWWWRNS